jgi:hypothetical protein
MATVTAGFTLTSAVGDLLTDGLALSDSTSITAANTSGLARKTLTSVSKTNRIACLDGDAATDGATLEGQFIDITDNHGITKRYVIMDGAATSVASNTIILADTDIGSTSTPAANLVGGIGIDVPASQTQHAVLTLLKTTINNTNGHNGSITAGAVSGTSDGTQSIALTNPTSGEGATFIIDNVNSTLSILDNTEDAQATNSALDHPILVNKSEFTSPAYVYIKNTAAYHASNGRVFVYYDNYGAESIMEIRGGAFAFVPLDTQNNLRAYTSTSGTIVEYMVFGTNA